MNIGEPLKHLGQVDIEPLVQAVHNLPDEAWTAQKIRQNEYEVHRQTESVVLVFTDGNGWPNIEIRKEQGWDLIAEQVMPVVSAILNDHYPPGGTLIRVMLAKLPAGNIIKPHTDKHPSFHASHRIHVPLTTNSRVRFMIDGKPHQFEVGQAYEINNQQNHSVMNKGQEDRITLIFDYLPAVAIERTA